MGTTTLVFSQVKSKVMHVANVLQKKQKKTHDSSVTPHTPAECGHSSKRREIMDDYEETPAKEIQPSHWRARLTSPDPQDYQCQSDSVKRAKGFAPLDTPAPGKEMAPIDFVQNVLRTYSASKAHSAVFIEEELESKEMTEKAELLSVTNIQPLHAAIYRDKVCQ